MGTHSRQITQIDQERLAAQEIGTDPAAPEMDVLQQHVCSDGQFGKRTGIEDGTVIANMFNHRRGKVLRVIPNPLGQVLFTRCCQIHKGYLFENLVDLLGKLPDIFEFQID